MIKKIVTVIAIIIVWENRHALTDYAMKFWNEGVTIPQIL